MNLGPRGEGPRGSSIRRHQPRTPCTRRSRHARRRGASARPGRATTTNFGAVRDVRDTGVPRPRPTPRPAFAARPRGDLDDGLHGRGHPEFYATDDGVSLAGAQAFFTDGGPVLTVLLRHDSGSVNRYSWMFLIGSSLLFAVHLPFLDRAEKRQGDPDGRDGPAVVRTRLGGTRCWHRKRWKLLDQGSVPFILFGISGRS